MSTTHAKSSKKSKKFKRGRNLFVNMGLQILVFFRSLYDSFIDFIFGMIYSSIKISLPSIDNSILTESAVSLAEKIRNKEISSETVVTTFIQQIKLLNPILNCVVDECFNLAIDEARSVDKYLSSTSATDVLKISKPFLGVPFTSKESTAAKGMKFSFGLLSRQDLRSPEDADIVEKTKNSGAILVGVTNVPELNLWCETRNNIYGQTNNPYNLSRTVGGSSGGEASLLAVAGIPLSLGTDIGGSARMPAYYCGVFGHKPTAGLTSSRGMSFRRGTEKETMVTAGPMTKYAIDIIPLLKVLLGDKTRFLQLDSEVDLKELNVIFIEEPGDPLVSPVNEDVKKVIRKAVNHLESVTETTAKKVSFTGFKFSYKLWKHAMTKEEGNFAFDMSNREKEVSLWAEIPLLLTGCTQFTLPPLMRLFDMNVLPAIKKKWAEETTEKLKKELLKELGENGILLFPSCPTSAPYHYASFFRPFNFAYWAIFNVLHLPVTQVPMGLDRNNLPVGMQVVGAPYKDHLTIAVARELEKAFGGWVSPFSLEKKRI